MLNTNYTSWQLIKYMPDEIHPGEKFLGWSKTHGAHECHQPDNVKHYKKIECVYGSRKTNNKSVWFQPTHWMPLPKEPIV